MPRKEPADAETAQRLSKVRSVMPLNAPSLPEARMRRVSALRR